MSHGQGYSTRGGNHYNCDPLEFLRGRLFTEEPTEPRAFPDNYPTEHDSAAIEYLEETEHE